MTNKENLIAEAKKAREKAYTPYSKFSVGAAIKTKSGKVYTGCNIEIAALSVSCCAERVAIFRAIADGERDFSELAVTGDTSKPISPCGSCRQVMSEFFDTSANMYLTNLNHDTKTMKINELLPFSFQPEDLVNGENDE
ncbi:cytidine deaminase [Virgibacillus sp. CBA3643]|uniref:cytidine deaminase n=1 Tax=Virgibacillus sp. CBA3643 TaxID=2942278 RepID=UPI0035A29B5B